MHEGNKSERCSKVYLIDLSKTTIKDGWHAISAQTHEVVFDTQNSTHNG